MRGYISSRSNADDYIDEETGMPVTGEVEWSGDIECSYKANSLSNRGVYIDGFFKQASYEITTEDMTFEGDYIRLKNRKGEVIWESEVLSLEELDSIQRIKIVI